jgi:hypothetical protein
LVVEASKTKLESQARSIKEQDQLKQNVMINIKFIAYLQVID